MNKNFIQKRSLLCTFASVLFMLFSSLVSYKVSAVSFTMNVGEPYLAGSFENGYCVYYNAGLQQSTIQNQSCQLWNNSSQISQSIDIYSFYTQPNIKTDKDKIYEITFRIVNRYDYDAVMINPQSPSQWKLLDIILDFSLSSSEYCDVYNYNYTSSNFISSQFCVNKSDSYSVSQYKAYFVYVGNNEYDSIGIYANVINNNFIAFNILNPVVEPRMYFDDILAYSVVIPDLQRAEQETQQATDEGNQNADSAGADNEGASQSLLDTAGVIVGAFSAAPTNCNLNADMGNVNLGNINFCQDKPTTIISIIDTAATILIAFASFRLIKGLIARFTSLTAYAQGGNS